MILTLGSSRRAASQSVVTSGSSAADVMTIQPFFFGSYFSTGPPASRQAAKPPAMWATGWRPMSCAVLAATREPASHVGDRLEAHVLRSLGGQRRTHAAGAMEDELLVALKDRLGIGTGRIDPEFQHAAGAGEGAWNPPVTLDLAGVADVDDHDVIALRGLDAVGRAQGFDLGIGLVDQRLDAAVDGLGHRWFLPSFRSDARHLVRNLDRISLHRDSGFALTRARNDEGYYRTSSFIAPSRPS